MVERNMIKEGFVRNSLTVSGTISGTQTVALDQIDALVDEDFSTTAVTITGGEFIGLDADLGARWKLDRIEYYTDDPTASGITMEISDNDLEYSIVTMTGSPPLYIGDIPDSTVFGAPRFIRLTHSGAADVDVQEWRAINDDSLVDFGSDGTQTEVEISDAPIGRPSEELETLALFNRFEKTATGFVFIDDTDTEADDEIQIAANSSGPFFGRTTIDGRQPDVTPWQLGELTNTRIVSSGSYSVDFQNGSAKGWTTTGFFSSTISGGIFVGTTSTLTPQFHIKNDFVAEERAEPENRFTFPAADFDTVTVKLKIPTIAPGDVIEGPRLFWRTESETLVESGGGFDSTKSTLAATASQSFVGNILDYTFDVGSVPTWSGVVRGFAVQPFELSTGTSLPLEFHRLDVSHSSGQERVTLNFEPVPSGSFPLLDKDSGTTDFSAGTYLSRRTIITQPCIITKVKVFGAVNTAPAADPGGVFLATISGTSDPTVGSNYTIKRTVPIKDNSFGAIGTNALMERNVFWPAEPGDLIGFAGIVFVFITGDSGDGATSTGFSILDLSTISDAQSDIDAVTFTIDDRNYLIEYEAIPAGPFVSTGTYKTPIFDGGEPPALLDISFEADEAAGTSIDSGGDAFSTLQARSSDIPPTTTLSLGQSTGVFHMFNEWPSINKPDDFAINTENTIVTLREAGNLDGLGLPNVAGTMFYHEQKDELWVINLLASGTLLDFRPTWDVFTVDTGAYIRTQAVGGLINYGYEAKFEVPDNDFIFEPVGFIPDYDREEIYIIQRNPGFFLGAGRYYGIVLDLDGNFKEVFMRRDTMGEPGLIGNNSNRMETMGAIAYDGSFFYILTDNTTNAKVREFIMVMRNGFSFDPRDVQFIEEVSVAGIPGLEFAVAGRDPRGIAFNDEDGLLYLYFENTTGAQGPTNRNPEIFTLQASLDDVDPDSVTSVSFALATTSGIIDPHPFKTGFQLESIDAFNTNFNSLLLSRRQLLFTNALIHIKSRDTFGLLQSRISAYNRDFFAPNSETVDEFQFFQDNSFSFFVEIGAGSVSGTATVLPAIANRDDALWGTASGTLDFETVAIGSALFPTGRFGQVEYTLNASSDGERAPFLLRSQMAQGLRVGEIPADGTRDIFLRTEIPEDKTITDQQGRLKVFWQLEE